MNTPLTTGWIRASLVILAACGFTIQATANELYEVIGVEPQPLLASAQRLDAALGSLGGGLSEADSAALEALKDAPHDAELSFAVQAILDKYCIAMININPEARVKVIPGPAQAELIQGGWKNFLVKVHNEAGSNAELKWSSPNADPVLHRSSGRPNPKPESAITPGQLANRFLELSFFRQRPLKPQLSGLGLEYVVLQAYTNDVGAREAKIGFNIGSGTEDIGARNAIDILFNCMPSVRVVLDVKDYDGEPVMASFTIRDYIERVADDDDTVESLAESYRLRNARRNPWQRPGLSPEPLVGIYPLPSRRVADAGEYEDFFFQPQIYRQTGEHVYLPAGEYDVTYTRGPEYLAQSRKMTVPSDVDTYTETFELQRWIRMADRDWYSLDHHVHAGGCSHYESPAAGVKPSAMMRQALGEDLNVSCVLSWGPCWYHQKTFFEGVDHKLSTPENLMRYDVEVSGFPSSHAGHLCLLRLKDDDYPGTTLIEEWPSYTLPVLQWGKEQNGIVGYSHSGWGLEPIEETDEFPNYVMAKFDGIGANEYIVTVTHDAVDFISAGDTPWNWELNIWYHVLNSGYRTAISGETDFPCIFDERVGMARSYAKITDQLNFDTFVDKIRDGLNYVSDGRSHIIDFAVEDTQSADGDIEHALAAPGEVTVSAEVAAHLSEAQDESGAKIQSNGYSGRPYWHLEKSRIEGTRKVPLDLVVNGEAVETIEIEADGEMRKVSFKTSIAQSSWVALRINYAAHTNPIYVLVDGKPIRASKKSTEWCRAAVDRCWEMKKERIEEDERAEAEAAYEHARRAYDRILAETGDQVAKLDQ
jgi:hypothetical protein